MYAHKLTPRVELPVVSLTCAETLIHEPPCPAKDTAIHTTFHGDSKSLP